MNLIKVIEISFYIHLTLLVDETWAQNRTITCGSRATIQFNCQDQRTCIERNHFCDEKTDCPDGSDEIVYDKAKHQSLGIPCRLKSDDNTVYNRTCLLLKNYTCDFEIDCIGGHDECNCNHTFQCNDGKSCTVKPSFCDHKQDCPDGTDEKQYNRITNIGFQCPVTKLHTSMNCVLPDQYVCDGESDCDYGIDECFCNFTEGGENGTYNTDVYSNDNCFRCLDGSLIIPNMHVCDGVIHCQDLSDECICSKENSTEMPICKFICQSSSCGCIGQLQCVGTNSRDNSTICVNHTSICDNIQDCQNGMDESNCYRVNDMFQCRDKKKYIKKFRFCNGADDCDDRSDEDSCVASTDHYCHFYRTYFPNVTDWDNASITIPSGRKLDFETPFHTIKCDGVPMCARLSDECNAGCNPLPKFCQYSAHIGVGFKCPVAGSVIIGKQVCDGKPTCNSLSPERSEDEMNCPNRFYCRDKGMSRLPIHLPNASRCDGRAECYDKSDEESCSEKTHFYCNDSGATIFVRQTQVCDRKQDCEGGSDECRNCNPSPFSSDNKLISNRVLIGFLWIISIFAVVGNCVVILNQIKNLVKPIGTSSTIVISNRILVLNLSTADLFVGIYLLALGIKDATTNKYCLLDQEWRSSSTCSALGVIAVIGTETSVFILMIMTAYRLYLVIRPFQKEKRLAIIISIMISWIFGFIIALIPLAPAAKDFFMSCVWFRNHRFIGYICQKELRSFVKNLLVYEGVNQTFNAIVRNGYTWDSMFAAMAKFNASYVPERYFGYYSAHSVCLPRLFPDPKQDESWSYSLFLIMLNFFALIFILVSYIIIYRFASRRSKKSRVSSEDRTVALQRKITRIVVTDFCCWMPICIMAFLKVSGVQISDEAYAVTAVILIPINSAMNPFLYSDVLDIVWKKMLPLRNWFNGTVLGKEIERRRTIRATRTTTAVTQASTVSSQRVEEQAPNQVDTQL